MKKSVVFALFSTLLLSLGCAKRASDTTPDSAPAPAEAASDEAVPAPEAEKAPEKAPEAAPASMPSAQGPTKGEKPEDRDQVDEDGVVRRGFALTANTDAISVKEGTAKSEELNGKMVKVSGKVSQVCAKKGCWFALTDDQGSMMRITSKGYKFFVPKDAVGKSAVVEGELQVKMLDVKTAQHFEDDRVEGTDEKPKKITEPQRSVSIAAIGVELRDS
jgi:hypothetical protein